MASTRTAARDKRSTSTQRNRPAETPIIDKKQALADYRVGWLSRHISILGRREVLMGRAKFGAFGAGKEVAQLAMAQVFEPGDWRSGYYRDQTFVYAAGIGTPQQSMAQLYGHTDIEADPFSAGRSMSNHYATHLLDEDGEWLSQVDRKNVSADIAPTAGQMPRLVGLAHASRLYREVDVLKSLTKFSSNGNEVAFATIGNGSCAEGFFWEAVNAIGVLQAPAVLSLWDDGYAISVPNEYQITKGDLSTVLSGFQYNPETGRGFNLYRVPGWDYERLVEAYREATAAARLDHIPAIIHVVEMTQPQGHSTSGSHERYKPDERMQFEKDADPLVKMRDWLIAKKFATKAELEAIEQETLEEAKQERDAAWQAYRAMLDGESAELQKVLQMLADESLHSGELLRIIEKLQSDGQVIRKRIMESAERALLITRNETNPTRDALLNWRKKYKATHHESYGSHQFVGGARSPLNVATIAVDYSNQPEQMRGFEVLRANFDALLAKDDRIVIFGEDVGHLGDVNQGLAGLQEKYGKLRVADTGIREATIVGQAIGMALRGLRPIAEIQYLDYIMYAIAPLTDDLANVHWRTRGKQAAPVIIRTRGHRLEGVFHSGSQMGGLLNLMRGIHVVVPRNMTQAAGFYNTLMQGDDPAIVVEVLNGYRLREQMPVNVGDFTVPLGVPEILQSGDDVTLVTYGACCQIAQVAVDRLTRLGISVELIDVQSLLPFDVEHSIAKSVDKTNRLIVLDEDMPGGASAYIMQQILETQGAYWSLDAKPLTITAQPHRPSYSTDGDYFSKPNAEDVVRAVYEMMHESNPARYPAWF